MTHLIFCEYIWLDGAKPVRQMRSKGRIISADTEEPALEDLPEWSFDGSSCEQATGHDSDCLLKPVRMVPDPFRPAPAYLVLCEVMNPDGAPHASNSRIQLRDVLSAGGEAHDPWFGFEQEFTLFKEGRPMGWPAYGFPAPQGPYYCGVGSKQITGRDLVEEHAQLCLEAGLMIYGINAEVMPGQWEYQIGYRGNDAEPADALTICDHMWLSRWMLHRLSEAYGIHVSLDNKPIKGDWNGAGMHTNYSTKETRDPRTGLATIESYIKALEGRHPEHIRLYGHGLDERLTGLHETASIHEFKAGAADRGSSIRIPRQVADKGYGYIEDRRPGANADPYLVAARLIATTCGLEEGVMRFTSWPREKAA